MKKIYFFDRCYIMHDLVATFKTIGGFVCFLLFGRTVGSLTYSSFPFSILCLKNTLENIYTYKMIGSFKKKKL